MSKKNQIPQCIIDLDEAFDERHRVADTLTDAFIDALEHGTAIPLEPEPPQEVQWLCKECFNEPSYAQVYDPYYHWTEEWYPSMAERRVCDGCGQQTECVPCEPDPRDGEDDIT